MRRFLLALLLLLGSGCTIAREFEGGSLSERHLLRLKGLKTKAAVLTELGPPNLIGLQLNESVFLYRFRREENENLNVALFQASFDYDQVDRRVDRLIVFFDKRGRVTRYGLDLATRAASEESEAAETPAPPEGR